MKLTKAERKEIDDYITNFKLDHEVGFTSMEILDVVNHYEDRINKDKFYEALRGNTCAQINGLIRTYPIDVYHAVLAGIEDRSLTIYEWD